MTDFDLEAAVIAAAANPPMVLAILAAAGLCAWIVKQMVEE